MLNIGKVLRGREDYCLDRVARSQEEYYTGAGEAPGYWLGHAAAQLGVAGQVTEAALHRILNAAHPVSAAWLGAPPRRVRVLAYDLTFRAPKSASLLFSLGEFRVAQHVRHAHEQAVAQALSYLERRAAIVARGHARQRQEHAGGVIAAAFHHRTSRAGDPLLHTHVLVANLGQGADGRWTALDGRPLYAHAKTAGYLYQAALRRELTERLGVRWGAVRRGVADIDGITRPTIEAFSKRRRQVRQRLAELGHRSARAAQAAALATRPAKPHVTQETLRARWRNHAAELGLTSRRLAAVVGQVKPAAALHARDIGLLFDDLAGEDGLTRHRSSFDRRDVIQAICDRLPSGAHVQEIEQLADQFLVDQRVVCLDHHDPPARPAFAPHDAAPDTGRFSTRDLLAVERGLIDTAARRRGEGAGTVPAGVLAAALAEHAQHEAVREAHGLPARPLAPEQLEMVQRLVGSGHGVELVNAKAGTGKTFGLRVARMAWERAGYQVIGATLAANAARQLSDQAGVDSRTIARLLLDLDDPRTPGFAPQAVLVIDEASMAGTRELARILWHAERAATKVVLVGDTQQLPEIDAGGAFGGLWRRLGGIELASNRRQQQPWEREALDLLRGGDATAALVRYHEHGRVVWRHRAHALRRQMIADWWAACQTGKPAPLLLAARRDDVAELNRLARELLAAAGRLGADTVRVGAHQFATGDRIVALRNARRLGILNGTRGTITAIDRDAQALLVRTDDGRDLVLPRWYVHGRHRRPWIGHGYAMTGHKAQGTTTDRCYVLASDELYKEWGYVAMSRGRVENRLYALTGDPPLADELDLFPDPLPDPLPTMAAALERSRAQQLALDHHPQIHPAGGAAPAARPPAGADQNLRLRLLGAYRHELLRLTEAQEALASRPRSARKRRTLARTIATGQRVIAGLEHALAQQPRQPAPSVQGSSDAQHPVHQPQPDPPRYLLAELGGRPHTDAAQALWRAAASDIDRFRARHAISDPTTALGPVPDDPHQQADHQAAQRALDVAMRQINTIEASPDIAIEHQDTID